MANRGRSGAPVEPAIAPFLQIGHTLIIGRLSGNQKLLLAMRSSCFLARLAHVGARTRRLPPQLAKSANHGGLENRYGRFLVHRGFESLPLRNKPDTVEFV